MTKVKGDAYMWHWSPTKFWGEKKKSTMHSDPINPCGWDSTLNLVTKLAELKKKTNLNFI